MTRLITAVDDVLVHKRLSLLLKFWSHARSRGRTQVSTVHSKLNRVTNSTSLGNSSNPTERSTSLKQVGAGSSKEVSDDDQLKAVAILTGRRADTTLESVIPHERTLSLKSPGEHALPFIRHQFRSLTSLMIVARVVILRENDVEQYRHQLSCSTTNKESR